MRRGILAVFALVCCASLLYFAALPGVVPAVAQNATVTFAPVFTATPTLPPDLDVIRQAQQAAQIAQQASNEAARRAESVSASLGLVQGVLVILIILGVVALLVGLILFVETRLNVGRQRDLMLQMVEESKQMRATQENVRMRFEDAEKLNQRVDTTLQSVQSEIRDGLQKVFDMHTQQVTALQTTVNERLMQLGEARKEVDERVNEMRNQIRDQLQVVYDRGDRQMRALTDALAAQVRDLVALRQEVEKTGQAFRDESRATIDSRIAELEQMRKDVEAVSQHYQLQIEDEIRAANNSLSDLETAHTRIDDALKNTQSEVFERVNKLTQALALAQTSHSAQASQALTLAMQAQGQIARGDLNGAARSLDRALELDDENRYFRMLRGSVYIRQGQLEQGMEQLRLAGAGRDEFPAADAMYAYALRLQGDAAANPDVRERLYTQATDMFLKVAEVAPDLLDDNGESAFGALAGLYRRQGRMAEAIALYDRMSRITPQNSYPLNNLGLIHVARGDDTTAKEFFQRSMALASRKLTINRADVYAWFDLITAEIALGDSIEEIAAHLTTALGLASDRNALAQFLHGLQYLQRAPIPPANIDQIVSGVAQELERRKLG